MLTDSNQTIVAPRLESEIDEVRWIVGYSGGEIGHYDDSNFVLVPLSDLNQLISLEEI
jgi:hypothetical protein